MNWKNEFFDLIEKELPAIWEEAVKDRRYLHMHPEVGFDTQNTEKYITEILKTLNVELLDAKMGVMGIIRGKDSSRIVALRADMDALPIQEANEVPYASVCPGKMHACGHDGHTSMLLGTARFLSEHRDLLPMDVLLVFQPAEEGPDLGGARVMLKDLQEKGIAKKIVNFFALHLFNDYPTGKVGVKYGSMAASTDEYDITILGKGGHAAQPHKCVDALSVGAQIVNSMESYMSRRMDPFDQAIFSVGIFHAGTAKNIIAQTAKIAGTIRCQREETRTQIIADMKNIVNGICAGYGAEAEINVLRGLPVLINEEKAVDYSAEVAEKIVGKENLMILQNPMMGAEDFAYFAEAIPSSFVWIGSASEEKGLTQQNHQPRFDFDEDALALGIRLLTGFAVHMQ
ncbi:MAG: amidohydrolase [Lachnospiraceae bacterium]|nr:amidohydrolase [Lachnospiraceae bacterium]